MEGDRRVIGGFHDSQRFLVTVQRREEVFGICIYLFPIGLLIRFDFV